MFTGIVEFCPGAGLSEEAAKKVRHEVLHLPKKQPGFTDLITPQKLVTLAAVDHCRLAVQTNQKSAPLLPLHARN